MSVPLDWYIVNPLLQKYWQLSLPDVGAVSDQKPLTGASAARYDIEQGTHCNAKIDMRGSLNASLPGEHTTLQEFAASNLYLKELREGRLLQHRVPESCFEAGQLH